jgi:aryl-alcohol dehydrogenase-like predicted oxidoreductase
MSRLLAGVALNPIGLGCMNVSHAYGLPVARDVGIRLIHEAIHLGVDYFDTAALYGFGGNETLVGEALRGRRSQVFLASKCGMTGVDGKRVIDGRPETLKATCDAALKRLQTDHIDLYYLHRWDRAVPIEESVGALADLVVAGKIRAVGLSEVSAATLLKAHAEHPIAAVQTEYSLWTRNPEIAVLKACADIGAALVAFSPLGRGFLAGGVSDLNFAERDVRAPMPRFREPNFSHNFQALAAFKALATEAGVSPAQLALSWVLSRGSHIHVIPGTTSSAHLRENLALVDVADAVLEEASRLINSQTIKGARYPASVQAEIDTEEFS